MSSEHIRQRVDALFADIARLAADPDSTSPRIRQELNALAARVQELEKQITKEATPNVEELVEVQTESNDQTSAPILYEKERVGYVFSGQTLQAIQGEEPDANNPDKVIVAPLTSGGQTIGKMQLESPSERAWTPEEASLIEAIAQQASQQIQSLRLLSTTERARAEAEAATRRFIHENWDSYLDAIRQSERVGFAYDQAAVTPYLAAPQSDGVKEQISVMDENIGALYLQPDPHRPLTHEDKAMIASIAKQVAQQVENIRLLADASRARAEAEAATRRLVRDSWQNYMEDQHESESFGFVYDQNRVSALDQLPSDINYSQPLVVNEEPIGQLAVAGDKTVSPEEAELIATIATQTSLHLETLRLNEELQKRAAQLQELDRLKSSFLANMSHELRTPLNSILGFSDVMLEGIDGTLTDYMENDLKLIQKNGKHLLHLINDVLDMAKIESGRMNLHLEKFKVHEVLDEVTSITSTLASEKGLSLFIEPDSDKQVEIFADMTRIRQVMINLVNNSIKFTEKGKVSMRVDRLENDKVMIKVQDTGIGVPASHLETIFQEFAQVDTSTTRKAGGTGLGLPISRRLVEMHGGRLWAESTGVNSEGTTLLVELPLIAQLTETIEKTAK